MNESVDQEARIQIAEITTVLWGPTKSNGLRHQVENHEERLDDLESWEQHCKEAAEMDKGRVEAGATVAAAKWQFWGIVVVQIISTVALLVLGK